MRSRTVRWLVALGIGVTLASPVHVAAQAQQYGQYPYVLVDVGTLGGSQAFLDLPGVVTTDQGVVLGSADTAIPDTHYPIFNPSMTPFPDPYLVHAFTWQRGRISDLGALPGNNSSAIFAVNSRGDGVGMSGNGAINPVAHWPEETAVMWRGGHIINLGTVPGGLESGAIAINDQGQVDGYALNNVPDPYSMIGSQAGTQTRTFLWQNGVMHDLGTLGGPDSLGLYMNARGQVAGQSYTNAVANQDSGIPTEDPFLWQDGHMQDLGTLGGDNGIPFALNDFGQVAGQSALAGDQALHPFLWSRGSLRDLGTLGGHYAGANYVNDQGTVVGWSTPAGDAVVHPFSWKDGVMTDLGTVPGASDPCWAAWDINYVGQVVGNGGMCSNNLYGVLWQHGTAADVNSLVAPSALHVYETQNINDWGVISGYATLTTAGHQYQRVVLLIPAPLARDEGIAQYAPAPTADGAAVAPLAATLAAAQASCPLGARSMPMPSVVRSVCALG
jgi:probable HAF family extracellular repeat protein